MTRTPNQIILTYATIGILLLLPLCVAVSVLVPSGLDRATIILVLSIVTICVALHILSSSDRNWLRIDTVFITGFLVVNFQWPLSYALSGDLPAYSFQSNSLTMHGNEAISLSAAALVSWLVGYKTFRQKRLVRVHDAVLDYRLLGVAFLISIVSFALFAGTEFFSRSIYKDIRVDVYQTIDGPAAYLYSIVEIMALASIAIYTYQMSPKTVLQRRSMRAENVRHYGLVVLVAVYSLLFLIGGDRGQVALAILGLALCIAARFRPVRVHEFLALAVLGFIAFSALGMLRAGQDFSIAVWSQSGGGWAASSNLAQSMVTTTQAVAIVEQRGGYYYGQLWISQILGLLPFMQGVFLNLTGWSIDDVSSAALITRYTLGNSPHSGLGTSFVADIYLNFGIPGVVIASVAHGNVSARMTTWLRGSRGILKYYSAVAFAALVFYVARGSALFQMKDIVWGIGLMILLVKFKRVTDRDPAGSRRVSLGELRG